MWTHVTAAIIKTETELARVQRTALRTGDVDSAHRVCPFSRSSASRLDGVVHQIEGTGKMDEATAQGKYSLRIDQLQKSQFICILI